METKKGVNPDAPNETDPHIIPFASTSSGRDIRKSQIPIRTIESLVSIERTGNDQPVSQFGSGDIPCQFIPLEEEA
jgi:hypothetical protein